MLKVNDGNAFLHPVTGQWIGPGHIYFETEEVKKDDFVQLDPDSQDDNQESSSQDNQSLPDNIPSEVKQEDGSSENNKKAPRGNRR
jgi:hypothetical protein